MSAPEINTILMETTFLVSGPSSMPGEEGRSRFGTAFIMLRQAKLDSPAGQYVLVTAKHVFEDIRGETATITLRKRNANGDPEALAYPLRIRDGGKALYTAHPTVDVAAIDVVLPNDSIVVQLGAGITNTNWLATDDFVKSIGLHPGDVLSCLGYPLGIGNTAGVYPVLRSGQIASYPLIPLKKAGMILYDFRVNPGNSGGPVYFAYAGRQMNGNTMLGTTYQKVFGIVIQQANPIQGRDPSLGVIVPSIYIKETIDLLAGFESKIQE